MANTKSAAKRARQTITRTLQNKRVISALKTQVKKARTAIGTGKKDVATTELRLTASALDRAAKTGRIHRNTARRLKSRLNKATAKLA
jgi:small subunit ribosomal protein S20